MYDAIAEVARPSSDSAGINGIPFRPIHYLGSKLRYLPEILRHIDMLDPARGTMCDLFSGSGTVSLAASRLRQIVSVDVQEYSRVICSGALGAPSQSVESTEIRRAINDSAVLRALQLACAPLLELERQGLQGASAGRLSLIRNIVEDGSIVAAERGRWSRDASVRTAIAHVLDGLAEAGLPGTASVCTRHFGGAFFSYAQSLELDAIADWARRADAGDMALAALLSTASEIVNTVGKQFAQPLRLTDKAGRVKTNLTGKILRERSVRALDVFVSFYERYACLPRGDGHHVAVRADYRQVLDRPPAPVSVIYADPPYTRDHYSRFYHVLETLALGDDPEIDQSNLGARMSRGFYRAERVQSDFCIKSKAPAAFEELFRLSARTGAPLLLSYSAFDDEKGGRPRLLAIRDVLAIGRRHYSRVDAVELEGADHSKLTSVAMTKGAGTTTEVLFACQAPVR